MYYDPESIFNDPSEKFYDRKSSRESLSTEIIPNIPMQARLILEIEITQGQKDYTFYSGAEDSRLRQGRDDRRLISDFQKDWVLNNIQPSLVEETLQRLAPSSSTYLNSHTIALSPMFPKICELLKVRSEISLSGQNRTELNFFEAVRRFRDPASLEIHLQPFLDGVTNSQGISARASYDKPLEFLLRNLYGDASDYWDQFKLMVNDFPLGDSALRKQYEDEDHARLVKIEEARKKEVAAKQAEFDRETEKIRQAEALKEKEYKAIEEANLRAIEAIFNPRRHAYMESNFFWRSGTSVEDILDGLFGKKASRPSAPEAQTAPQNGSRNAKGETFSGRPAQYPSSQPSYAKTTPASVRKTEGSPVPRPLVLTEATVNKTVTSLGELSGKYERAAEALAREALSPTIEGILTKGDVPYIIDGLNAYVVLSVAAKPEMTDSEAQQVVNGLTKVLLSARPDIRANNDSSKLKTALLKLCATDSAIIVDPTKTVVYRQVISNMNNIAYFNKLLEN